MKKKAKLLSTLKAIMLLAVFLIINGCLPFIAIKSIYSKRLHHRSMSFAQKELIFVPISHVGQLVFYNSLKDSIVYWKSKGYTIYYEQIIHNKPSDDLLQLDTIVLKYRKTAGGIANTRQYYDSLMKIFLRGAIVQPEYGLLGIDSLDVNADITLTAYIQEYERLYGEIKLDDYDYTIPKYGKYDYEPSKNDRSLIVVDYRNQQLLKRIKDADCRQIVIVYGYVHVRDVMKMLKKEKARQI